MILYSSNAPSIALYIYIFLFLALSLYISDIARNQQVSFFYDLMSASRDTLNRICFILIMASLVGTPLTTGFFYKMHIFSTLSLQSPLTWFGATIINLILLVFYLQVIRHPQVSRKLRIRRFP